MLKIVQILRIVQMSRILQMFENCTNVENCSIVENCTNPENDEIIITLTFEELQKKIQKIIPHATFKINCNKGYLYEFYFYLNKDFTPSTNSRFSNSCHNAKLIFKLNSSSKH